MKWTCDGVEYAVGDRVRVVRFPVDKENAMGEGVLWENCWIDGMDDAIRLGNIGAEFEIHDIRIEGVEFCPTVDWDTRLTEYLYPLSSLEKVQ